MGPMAGLDGCGKSRLPPGFDPRAVQPVAGRYTDRAIPAHLCYVGLADLMPVSLGNRSVISLVIQVRFDSLTCSLQLIIV
jgi:hypothetical protein